ncbi:MAG: 7-cyano-7-deazaguanine synthase QueC, partial [Bacteroidia bacterium]|nr:7-cyano-7-deazaguanine synthase QueC [Bacteroidia bacterium]
MHTYEAQDALVLFSGGQDSTTCLYWAKQHFRHTHALCFSYGQRHTQEVENARRLAAMADVPFRVLDTTIISQLAPNSLTDKSMMMDREKPANTYPNTFVPGRNLLFLTFAATLAYAQDIRHLVTGVSEADYSGYPDCRDTFIHSANTTLNLAMDKQFVIHTPLMWRNKKEVWQLADELGVFDIVRNET